MTHGKGMCIHTLGANYAVLQRHTCSVGINAGQMDRWTPICTDRYTEGHSHTCWEPVLRGLTDLASAWPLQRALKRLEDNLPHPLSVPPSLHPPSFCPRFGLCPDNQSHWWLCFQLSQPPFPPPPHHSPPCSVGNIQESRADEPKEMFWKTASAVKPDWHQPHTGTKSVKEKLWAGGVFFF